MHLGAALGTDEFKITYVNEKVEEWCKEMKNLSKLAKTQPHEACSAYIQVAKKIHLLFTNNRRYERAYKAPSWHHNGHLSSSNI